MLQDIINKNEIASDNSIKLIETSLTEIGAEPSTQTGRLTLRELQGFDRELRTTSGSLRSAIAKAMAKQVDIDKENRKLEEMPNDKTYSDEQRKEVRARLQSFQDERKAIDNQIRILKGRYSNQIYQIRESIMKFLDKETGTLGERIRTVFKEQLCNDSIHINSCWYGYRSFDGSSTRWSYWALQLHLYGGVWPQDRKTDPSTY